MSEYPLGHVNCDDIALVATFVSDRRNIILYMSITASRYIRLPGDSETVRTVPLKCRSFLHSSYQK